MAEQAQQQSPSMAMKVVSADELQLVVGTPLKLLRKGQRVVEQLDSSLIGWIRGEALIVRTPRERSFAIRFERAERLIVRLFGGRFAYSFECDVVYVQNTPIELLYLSFPQTVQGTALRKALRARFEIAAELQPKAGGDAAAVRIVDLSSDGAQLQVPGPLQLAVDDRIGLRFQVDVGGETVQIQTDASVKNAKDIGEQGSSVGVQFEPLDLVKRLALNNLVYLKRYGE